MSVTQLRPEDLATIALARLRATNSLTFAEIVDNFAALHLQAMNNCVLAPVDKVQVMQGKAQQLADLVEMLRGCTDKAKALDAKMKEK